VFAKIIPMEHSESLSAQTINDARREFRRNYRACLQRSFQRWLAGTLLRTNWAESRRPHCIHPEISANRLAVT
jgi:hypothetical protein